MTRRVVCCESCVNLDYIVEVETFSSDSVSAVKEHCIFVGRSTCVTSVYGEVKILMSWLNM
jgi:hypothetical protein